MPDAIRPTAEDEEAYGDDPDWIELGALADAIVESRAETKRLEDERAVLYRRLVIDKGVSRAAVARRSGVGDMAVRFVLEPELKKKRPGRDKAKAATS